MDNSINTQNAGNAIKLAPEIATASENPGSLNVNTPDLYISQAAARTARLAQIPFWATLVSYVIGFLWISCLPLKYNWMPDHGMTTLFTAVFFLWGELTLKSIPRPGKECWFWMACALCIAVGIDLPREVTFIHDKGQEILMPDEEVPLMSGWNYFALHCIAIYWILCRSGKLVEMKTSAMFLLDGLTGLIIAPACGIANRIKRITLGIKSIKNSSNTLKNTVISGIAILLVLPVLYLVVSLLSKVDDSFRDIWLNLHDTISELDSGESLLRFILGIFVSWFLFSLISACVVWEKPVFSSEKVHHSLESIRIVPQMGCMIIYSSFIALYLLFFGSQSSSLLAAFWGVVPGDLTASNFARQGFFELCAVMTINFGLILGVSKFGQTALHESAGLRVLTYVLLSESILLAITAASKLILYINRFGFTSLRLLSIWAILVLTCGCILSIIATHKNKSQIDKWIWFTIATFVPLCFF